MAEVPEVKYLEKITSEVDESQIKIIFSRQCFKAQASLADKLKKGIQNCKQTCGQISSANLKLQSEIVEAEQKINSMLIAQETIKMANVELKKELLLAKQKKLDIIDRIEEGEKKYEALWIESKKRYESLPYVKVLLTTNEKADNLKNEISKLEDASLKLVEEIDNKTVVCSNIDKKRIIDMANLIVNEMPQTIKIIEKKTRLINELEDKLKEFINNKDSAREKGQEKVVVKNDTELSVNNHDGFIMPKLELPSLDFDVLSKKLDQVKLKNANAYKMNNDHTTEDKDVFPKTSFKINKFHDKNKTSDLMSAYFTKTNYEMSDTENYSKRKLINIIQDIKVDTDEVLNMISKVNREALHPVESIGSIQKNVDEVQNTPRLSLEKKSKEPIQSDKIEEIDMTCARDENILLPPSPFLDITVTIAKENQDDEAEEVANRKEEGISKRVSFDLPSQTDGLNDDSNENDKENDEDHANQLEVSAVSDDGFEKIKDMVLKKHNLDLSPQFVYAKNTQLQKKTDDEIVTSKFFEKYEDKDNDNNVNENDKKEAAEQANDNPIENDSGAAIKQATKKVKQLDVNDDISSSPKRQKVEEVPESMKTVVSGLLFNHGAQAIPDSLDISISTTGFEDGDANFPHCLDASLLLSPKADIPMSVDDPEVTSQELPNFFSGLRKPGLSLFGRLPSSEFKVDSNAPNPGTSSGFSFNFGGGDKKNRGGLFSIFK